MRRGKAAAGKPRYLGLGGWGGSPEPAPSIQWHCASRCLLTPTNRITPEIDRRSHQIHQIHVPSGGRQFPKGSETQNPLT